jgi:tetratricopeptide (TPR) repeat protein
MTNNLRRTDIWEQLIKNISSKLTGKAFDGVISLLITLVSKEEEHLTLLYEIDENVKRIVTAPFKTGMAHLNDARSAKGAPLKQKLIQDARRKFSEAANLDYPFPAAEAKAMVGVCYQLLREEQLALSWYEQSYESAHSYLNKLLDGKVTFAAYARFGFDLLLFLTGIGIPVVMWRHRNDSSDEKVFVSHVEEVYDFLEKWQPFILNLGSSNVTVKKDLPYRGSLPSISADSPVTPIY